MKLEIYLIDDTWARVKFHNDNDHYLGVLAPSRGNSLSEIIRAAHLAGWTIVFPNGGEEEELKAYPGLCFDCHQRIATFEGRCSTCNEMEMAVEEAEQLHYERWLNGEE